MHGQTFMMGLKCSLIYIYRCSVLVRRERRERRERVSLVLRECFCFGE
jgi:hypothetical protein